MDVNEKGRQKLGRQSVWQHVKHEAMFWSIAGTKEGTCESSAFPWRDLISVAAVLSEEKFLSRSRWQRYSGGGRGGGGDRGGRICSSLMTLMTYLSEHLMKRTPMKSGYCRTKRAMTRLYKDNTQSSSWMLPSNSYTCNRKSVTVCSVITPRSTYLDHKLSHWRHHLIGENTLNKNLVTVCYVNTKSVSTPETENRLPSVLYPLVAQQKISHVCSGMTKSAMTPKTAHGDGEGGGEGSSHLFHTFLSPYVRQTGFTPCCLCWFIRLVSHLAVSACSSGLFHTFLLLHRAMLWRCLYVEEFALFATLS